MGREHNNCLGGRCTSRNGLNNESTPRGSELLGENSYNRGGRYRNGDDRAMLYPRPGATRDIVDSLLSQSYNGNGGMYGRNNFTSMGGGHAGQGDFGGCRSGGLGGMGAGQGDLGGRLGGMGGLGGMGMGGLAHDDLIGGPHGRRGGLHQGLRSPLDSPMNLPYPTGDLHGRLHPGSPQSHLGRQPLMSGALPHGSRSRLPLHSPSMSSIFDPYRMDRPRMPYGPEAMAGRRPSNYRAPYVEDYESEIEADMVEQAMMQHMYGMQGGMGDGYFGMDGGYGYGGGMGGGMGGMGMGGMGMGGMGMGGRMG